MFKILGAKNRRKNLHKHPGPPFQIREGPGSFSNAKNSNAVWNQRIGHGKTKQILLLLQLARFPDFAHKNLFVSVWKIMDNGCASFSNKKHGYYSTIYFSVKSIWTKDAKYLASAKFKGLSFDVSESKIVSFSKRKREFTSLGPFSVEKIWLLWSYNSAVANEIRLTYF